MKQKINAIRKKLYLLRNGVSATSIREKGSGYKMNWGVPILSLREIARQYAPDSELAEQLWKENTRELKILATLIQNPATFSEADEWVNEIFNSELAEQATMNLFSRLPNAGDLAEKWIESTKTFIQLTGFLLYTRLFAANYSLSVEQEKKYFIAVSEAFMSESLLVKNAALNSLRFLGRQSILKAKTILAQIKDNQKLPDDLRENLHEDLSFEFYS